MSLRPGINPRFAYQMLAECMLRLEGKLTRESERGISDALNAKLYRDSATARKDPTTRGEYDNGWELGRWIKIDKRPQPQDLIQHEYAREMYGKFATAARRL